MYILYYLHAPAVNAEVLRRRDLRLSVRGIVFRAIGFSELLFYDWKTESKHGRQSRNLSWNQPTNANGGSAASTIMP